MMKNRPNIAIRVQGMSKKFHIGGPQKRYETLRDKLADVFWGPLRRANKLLHGQPGGATEMDEIIWALKDITFEVERGEVVGIIGHNGAGKSTLLKILTGITEPTTGFAQVYGRMASLLEVGTGFHHELTGRENIYLNGAILGMKRGEIDRKFDEIVAFSEVAKFIDTPVKHYSSGMLMRLAFAVSAHLEPETLVVDEVLAVGDAAFQKKCVGKMSQVAGEGRTVLFVSHNMSAIEHLCSRVMLLQDGHILMDGNPEKAIAAYLSILSEGTGQIDLSSLKRAPNLMPVIQKIEFFDQHGQSVTAVPVGASLTIHIHYKHCEPLRDPYFGMTFETSVGVKIFWVQTRLQKGNLPDLPSEGTVVCHLPRLPLLPGTYLISPGCGSRRQQLDYIPRSCQIQVTEADIFGTGQLPPSSHALVVVEADWDVI